ncbi:MAG: rhomboid family intramembrane serine protease, partial [Bacteroidia bacterium]|nr:rhomboid family intramembrane serine protease [Bacteroidia bacterium]
DATVWAADVFGGVAGGVCFVAAYHLLPAFAQRSAMLLGASAGVNGVLVAAAAVVPNYPLYLLFFGVVRLKWLAIVGVALDLILIAGSNPGGMIAHVGGAAMGWALIALRRRGVDLSSPFEYSRYTLRYREPERDYSSPRMRVVHRTPPPKPTPQEIDRILDKIQAVGYHNLTKEEKQTLFRASQE